MEFYCLVSREERVGEIGTGPERIREILIRGEYAFPNDNFFGGWGKAG